MIRETLFVCSLTLIATVSTPSFGDALEPDFESSAERSQPMKAVKPDRRAQPRQSEKPEGRQEWREVLLATEGRGGIGDAADVSSSASGSLAQAVDMAYSPAAALISASTLSSSPFNSASAAAAVSAVCF